MANSIFLDANVYLSFYSYGKDDLEALEKLLLLVEHEEIKLYTNSHLLNEVERNREKKIAEANGNLQGHSFRRDFPNYFRSYEGLTELNKTLARASLLYKALLEEIRGDIKDKKLRADDLIEKLFKSSVYTEVDQELVEKARLRAELGNPPGKRSSIGDAIHWVDVLARAGSSIKFNIVSNDADFASPLDEKSISSFLYKEWQEINGDYSEVFLFRSLSDYLARHHPEIVLSQEAVKDDLIVRLAESPSFSATHQIVSELSTFSKFTFRQMRQLFQALVSNNQVRWIATDPDILEFYLRFENAAWQLPDALTEEAEKILEKEQGFFSYLF